MRIQKIKVSKWLINSAKEQGIDIDGFEHEITEFFIKHVLNEHGNSERERSRGQIPVTDDIFDKIADVVNSPDFVMIGAKRDGNDVLYYAKKIAIGTIVYAEDRINSKKRRALSGKTMFIRKNEINEKKFTNLISMNRKTDILNAKIVCSVGTGSNPSYTPNNSAAVANPVQPSELLSNNSI